MVNKAVVLGRVGKNPELKYTPSGGAVVNFSVATTKKWKDKQGQQQERTEWHRIVAWQKLAELCGQYVHKGSLVFVEGEIQTREWQDKEGQKRFTTEIVASEVRFLESKGSSQGWGGDTEGSDAECEPGMFG